MAWRWKWQVRFWMVSNESVILKVRLESDREYTNPLYEIKEFYALFTAPSGRELKINGFWDGRTIWKIRFMPDETGDWSYKTVCSDNDNAGLHGNTGSFTCISGESELSIYKHGPVISTRGNYHLQHQDGMPFFWLGCTAWNGGLKSTPEEWEHYLEQRAQFGYNVIQLVGTVSILMSWKIVGSISDRKFSKTNLRDFLPTIPLVVPG